MASIIMKEFCAEIEKHLNSLAILKFIRNEIKWIITSFESLHIILHIPNAINDGHIPIIIPNIDLKLYYY